MPASTASVADVPRMDLSNKAGWNNAGNAQCIPIPWPALGTQKIIQGNGTNVGTVITLQCPAKHRVVGSDLKCVMGLSNSAHWEGVGDGMEAHYCKPVSDFGFHVAVLASIVSSGIILVMSIAFITCCLVDCIKEDKRKKQERELETLQWDEQAQENNRPRYSHKGRNNNNNNFQETRLSPWDTSNPAMCDSMRPCRCQEQYAYGPACNYGPTPPPAALPGQDYDQPFLTQYPDCAPPQYPGPPLSSCQTVNPGLFHMLAVGPGLAWQCGEQQNSLSGVNTSTADDLSTRNENSNRNITPKEFSIRIISV
ncbi:uncharacterized protein susd3 [Pholidichthys leucotaenia]